MLINMIIANGAIGLALLQILVMLSKKYRYGRLQEICSGVNYCLGNDDCRHKVTLYGRRRV